MAPAPTARKQVHLNLFLNNFGGHPAAPWLDETDRSRITDIAHWQAIARRAEAAKLDALFIAGASGFVRPPRFNPLFGLDTVVTLTALAGVTSRIGLIPTISTTFSEPWQTARTLASLDHVSGGRAGWNIVTSTSENEAHNFGYDRLPDHEARYDRAREFVEVALRLWESFDADAVVEGRARGAIIDPDRIREIDHLGRWFRVKGPLAVPASPQVVPVLSQAGSSETGIDMAARYGELVYAGSLSLEDGKRYGEAVRARMPLYGRGPQDVRILPNFIPVIGRTEDEVRAKRDYLERHVHPETAFATLNELLKVDFTGHDLDGPVPPLPPASQINGHRGHYQRVADYVHGNNPSLRELLAWVGNAQRKQISGTPAELADVIETWVEAGAADGFNVLPATYPSGFHDVCDLLVPELQRRGRFRTDYAETGLRARFGTRPPRPAPVLPQIEAAQ